MHDVPHDCADVIANAHDTEPVPPPPLSQRLTALVPDDDIWTHALMEEHAAGPGLSTLVRLEERRAELAPATLREDAPPGVLAAAWALTAAIAESTQNTFMLHRARIWAAIDLGVAA